MYGLVNKAIQDMVCQFHGEATWEVIKQKADLDSVDYFVGMEPYPDDVTHRLVRAACEVLGLSSDEILKAFGEYWVTCTAQEGYGELLDSAGDSLPEFVENLDNLHARVGLSFPKLQPPSFDCEETGDQSMELHYQSDRHGLAPMVVGLIHGLGKRFNTSVNVQQTEFRGQGAHHDICSIQYDEQPSDDV
jgi:hypothetical protein